MASQLIESHTENAEIYHGEAICKQKSRELLEEYSLPKGLLPIEILQLGHNRSSRFIWLKQKQKKVHKNKRINKTVTYDVEVTAFIEKGRLRNMTGVKSNELLLWVTISDIYIGDPSTGKIMFAVPNGMSRSYPISAFDEEDKDNGQKSSN